MTTTQQMIREQITLAIQGAIESIPPDGGLVSLQGYFSKRDTWVNESAENIERIIESRIISYLEMPLIGHPEDLDEQRGWAELRRRQRLALRGKV